MPPSAAKALDYTFGKPSLAPAPLTAFSYDGNLNAGDTTEQTFYSEWTLVNGAAVGQRGTAG